MQKNDEVIARRVLPWILIDKFRNTFTGALVSNIKDNEIRGEFYVKERGFLYTPGAASFIVSSVKPQYEVSDNTLTIKSVSGVLYGYAFDGMGKQFNAEDIMTVEELNKHIAKGETEVNDFAVSEVVNTVYRLSAGKTFGAIIKAKLKKHGIEIDNLGKTTISTIHVREGGIHGKYTTEIYLYKIKKDNYSIVTPGVVGGAIRLLSDGILSLEPGVKGVINDFLKDVKDAGERISPMTPILQSTNKSRFTYNIGEFDLDPDAISDLKRENNNSTQLFILRKGFGSGSGTFMEVFADLYNRKIYANVNMFPYSSPAMLVLNFPPFTLAPLSAVYKEYEHKVVEIGRESASRFKNKVWKITGASADVNLYLNDFKVFGDAKVYVSDIRHALYEGYPSIQTLEAILDKMEPLQNIGKVLQLAVGPVNKVDKVLLSGLPSKVSKTNTKENNVEL